MKHHGYSLLECAMCLFIIAIIAAFGLSNYQSQLLTAQEKLVSLQLKHLLQMAQREAVKHQHAVGVCGTQDGTTCSLNWSRGQLVFLDQGTQPLPVVSKERLLHWVENTRAKGVISMRAYPNHRQYVQVRASTQTDNATFWYCDVHQQAKWALTVSRSGDIAKRLPNKHGALKDSHGNALGCR